jgi:Tol biopolymer transport system component
MTIPRMAALAPTVLAALAVASALAGCGGRRSTPDDSRPIPEPLTTRAAYDGQPHVSPDGKRLVFAARGAVDLDVFTMSLEGRDRTPALLYAGPGDDRSPRWSPDGASVLFTSYAEGAGDIAVVPAGGGEARRLTVESSDDRQPAWSPDGARVAFVSDRSGRTEVWLLTLSTGEASSLSSQAPPAADYRLSDPAWTGDDILVSAEVSGVVDLWAIPTGGGAWRRVTDGPARERHPNPGPGGRLAFASDTTGWFNLFVREADGRVTTVTEERTDIHESAWGPDGTTLYVTRRSAEALLAVPFAGGAVDTLLPARGRNAHPSWSPDGSEVAFHSDIEAQDDIWRLQVDDGAAGPVTASLSDDTDPDWSPASGQILFTSRRSGNADVWVMDPSGIEYENLSNDPAEDREARWFPDGRSVVFVSERLGKTDLWVVDRTGGEPRRVTDDDIVEAWPCVLADGQTIVYEAEAGGVRALFAVPIAGGQPTRLTTPAGEGAWDGRPAPVPGAPNGLVFTRSAGGDRAIWRLVIGGEPTLLADDPTALEDHPAVSADGARVVFQSGANYDLWRIDVPVPPRPAN